MAREHSRPPRCRADTHAMATSNALSLAHVPPRAVEGEATWDVVERDDAVVLLRRRGSSEPSPSDWRERVRAAFDAMPSLGVAGAKRLSPDGRVLAMGDFIVHPKGFHHIGRGVPRGAFQFATEVDAISGGMIGVEAGLCDDLGGPGALSGHLGAITLSLAARARGLRVVALADVEVVDAFTPRPDAEERERFTARFGFDWRAADLDQVRAGHAGGGLLWNVRFFGGSPRYEKYDTRPHLHWTMYDETPSYRSRADGLVKFIASQARAAAGAGAPSAAPSLLDLGCGDGLFSHLMAQSGLSVTGFDLEANAIEQASSKTAARPYPGLPPAFMHVQPGPLPVADGTFDCVAMLDVIEHLPNPVALLREARRALRPGGALVVVTPEWQFGAWSDAVYHVTEYTQDELSAQLAAVGYDVTQRGRVGPPYRDVIVVGRKPGH